MAQAVPLVGVAGAAAALLIIGINHYAAVIGHRRAGARRLMPLRV